MTADADRSDAEPPAFEPASYGSWYETALGRLVWHDERAALLPLLGSVDGLAVLDAGTGDGRLALELTRRGARVTGVDTSHPMLRAAHHRLAPSAAQPALAAGRLEALPFRDASFDVAVAVTVLCFVPAPALAVRELARVLRPGGRLVVAELGRWSSWAARRRLRGLLGDARWRHARFWTPGSLDRLVEHGGLETVGRGAAVFYPPSALAGRLCRRLEAALSRRRTAVGAALLVVATVKR